MNGPIIGIDIGGTGIKGGIVDLSAGKLMSEPLCLPTPEPASPEAVAEVVARIAEELSARAQGPKAHSPVGITFPGIIRNGVVHSAANLDNNWLDTDINAFLSKRLEREVEALNDADAAGLAELRYGAGAGANGSVLVITLGTGIGSALIFNGELVPNSELGHLEIDGVAAEAKASAVARERNGVSWNDYSILLQRYFSHLEFLFSPELFIVGGGISQRAEEFLPGINLRAPIVQAALRNDAGIVGAAITANQKHTIARQSHAHSAVSGTSNFFFGKFAQQESSGRFRQLRFLVRPVSNK